ncbi:MAG: response regulator [Deltaproteobacteria bacterium]|nr:response regulator [Deltaproteobacteria bacterium]MBW2051967.1 response regulator [Deltaproteobacteria bacterium]MBW2140503.1 response regulator [Deltaproteobacteria bacterium]MBW2322356.1 response regulator [Deltaproteobacteria bacterium]
MKTQMINSIPIKLLAVDDEKEITDLLVRHFTFLGYDITGVNDPLAALRLIEEGNYHIAIVDIVMPGMDGLELLKHIKTYNGGIKVIMITGYVTMHNVLTAMRYGADNVFFKPLTDLNKLESSVGEAISKLRMWQDILRELQALGKKEEPDG